MTRGNETDERTAVEALYDAFAPSLYRYAWSLLGDDPAQVADAVHDGLVADVALDSRRTDPADRGPWLYALVRAACQRRGLTHVSPYDRLATVPDEEPVARMFARLPASHRELVELNLRHALPTSAVARVLGLDPQICGELSRSAIRRAAESLDDGTEIPADDPHAAEVTDGGEEGEPGGLGTAAWRVQVHHVSCALSLLRPPGPPPELRDRVVRTCLEPDLAPARERAAAQMRPLTGEGYPLHRSRAAEETGEVEEEAESAGSGAEPPPRIPPDDRLTTRDHPVREEMMVASLAGPDAGADDRERPAARHRWPLPAVSGLATVALAVALWSWASAVGGPSTVIGVEPDESERNPMVSEVETAATSADTKPEADPVTETPVAPPERTRPQEEEQSEATPGPEAEDEGDDGRGTPGSGEGSPAPPAGETSPSPGDEASGGGASEGGAAAQGGGASGDDATPDDQEDESGDGGDEGLFDGLLGLLFGRG
ncbi:RNA polymerase sigma factor [Nocardiopsis halotolerans]|uniref:hypothetical protein n=1 Tax=Nocardiopsis halotolerans TaxID=124252 RepID=UPI0003472E26|nr:hypothetical protein [Nocardiopsis halotolerans]